MRIRKERQEQIREAVLEIEKFVVGIPDSTDRQIFELVFLEGMKQCEVGEKVGLERSVVSKRISNYLKFAHKAQK